MPYHANAASLPIPARGGSPLSSEGPHGTLWSHQLNSLGPCISFLWGFVLRLARLGDCCLGGESSHEIVGVLFLHNRKLKENGNHLQSLGQSA